MQKKLIALAVAAAASSGAFAQTTIYGILDTSAYQLHGKESKNTYGFGTNMVASSRLGFKGTEDLGDGLNAVFNLEQELNLATGAIGSASSGSQTGTDNGFNRQANVGLSSAKLGTVMLGRQATPTYTTVAQSDVFGWNSGGLLNAWVRSHLDNANVLTGVTHTTSNTDGGVILPGAYAAGMSYATPVLGGFQAKYFTNVGNGILGSSFNNNGITDLSASFSMAGAVVRAAQQKVRTRDAAAPYNTNFVEFKDTTLSAAYTIAGIKLAAAQSRTDYSDNLVNHDTKIVTLGASYKMGNATVGASLTTSKDTTNTDNKATNTMLMGNYDLSKRTAVYALLSSVKNKGAATMTGLYAVGAVSATALMNDREATNRGFAMGVKHVF